MPKLGKGNVRLPAPSSLVGAIVVPLRQSACTSSVVTNGRAGSDDAPILRPNKQLCGAGASDGPK